MTNIDTKIKPFLALLSSKISPSEYQLADPKKELGLIISRRPVKEVLGFFVENWIILDITPSAETFESALVQAIQERKHVLITITSNISNDLIAQLKEYTSRGIITSTDKKSVYNPQDINIVCLVAPEILEQISYPYFQAMFGPIISDSK